MDINKICEEIIADIIENGSISGILLKAQILASALQIEEFAQWVNNEQNGYEKPFKVPDYRKLRCNVTALLSIPFHATQTEMTVPVEAIQHKGTQQMLSTIYYSESAIEAERIATSAEESLIRKPTTSGHQFIQDLFPLAQVEAIYQDLSPFPFYLLVESVKSRLHNFILQLDKADEIVVTFPRPVNKDEVSKIFYQDITSCVVNNGKDSIEVEDLVLFSQETLSEHDAQQLKTMFSRLSVLVGEETDHMLKQEAVALNAELQFASPRRNVVKKRLAIIKGLAMGTYSSEIAIIINAALAIL